MASNPTDTPPLEQPLAELERQLIAAYITSAGEDLAVLLTRTDTAAREILARASRYASDKLSEVEARSHFLHELRGER